MILKGTKREDKKVAPPAHAMRQGLFSDPNTEATEKRKRGRYPFLLC